MFNVNISIEENEILGNLIVDSYFFDKSKYEYAFYLYKDNEVSDRQWYSESMKVGFDVEDESGFFHIRCFIRDKEAMNIRGYNSEKLSINANAYNIDSWKKAVKKTNLQEFEKELDIENGIYQFALENSTIDILFDGLERFKLNRGILVCFSGAITNRKSKYAPFFSGLNIAQKLDMPIISVADPSIAMSNQLALAWYAGNRNVKNLPNFIADILDIVSIKFSTKLTLFGGSGGGFAALAVAERVSRPTNVVVWNPQTSISEYLKNSVINYLTICFPNNNESVDIYSRLESTGINHDLLVNYEETEKEFNILYLQNLGDELHLQSHAKPLMQKLDIKQSNENCYFSEQGITFWLKYWGEGHIVPSEDVITKSLLEMIDNKTSKEIAESLI
ncbi:hypothetical protein [uncultured Psychrobacter sp.]|uniref:hypothetical protein n=1 Tax=uncultured Psychrobacter sp. TaxID=259303 RepID=UPI003459261B